MENQQDQVRVLKDRYVPIQDLPWVKKEHGESISTEETLNHLTTQLLTRSSQLDQRTSSDRGGGSTYFPVEQSRPHDIPRHSGLHGHKYMHAAHLLPTHLSTPQPRT